MGHLLSKAKVTERFLQDCTVWVTGASSGLGRSLAIICAKQGAKVVLSARDLQKLEAVKSECLIASTSRASTKVFVQPLDMKNFRDVGTGSFKEIAEAVAQRMSGIDILINNAGVSVRSFALQTDLKVDMEIMDTNFWGSVVLTKAVVPYLQKSKAGRIIVINSVQGKLGLGERSAYAASKHALTGYFDSLRAELSVDRILVTAVFAGYIRTELSRNALTGTGTQYGKLDEATAKGADPDAVAAYIMRAAAAGGAEVICAPLDARMAIVLRNILPRAIFTILARRAQKSIRNGQKVR